jgi:hypothetical protein
MNSFLAGPNDAVDRAGAISVALVSSKAAELLYERSYQSDRRPATPSHRGEAKEGGAEQRD